MVRSKHILKDHNGRATQMLRLPFRALRAVRRAEKPMQKVGGFARSVFGI